MKRSLPTASVHRPRPYLYLICLLLSLSLLGSLLACTAMQGTELSDTPDTSSADSTSPPEPDQTEAPGVSDELSDSLLYYVALVEDLQEELRELKAENFILSSALSGTEPPADTDASLSPVLPYTYERDDDEITILSYTGREGSVSVPATIDGYPVTKIGENAFAGTSVVSVTLPDSIEEIDWFAFLNCASLKTVTAGSALSEVGYGAFDGCSSGLTLICPAGSYLARYGQSFGIAVKHS